MKFQVNECIVFRLFLPHYVDVNFTAKVEEQLDKVSGEMCWFTLLWLKLCACGLHDKGGGAAG
jgi:hypothetical protein